MSYDYVDQLDKFTLQKLGIKKVIQVDNRMARLLFQNRGTRKVYQGTANGYMFYELHGGLVTDLGGDSWDNLHQFKDDLNLYDTDNTSYKITEI